MWGQSCVHSPPAGGRSEEAKPEATNSDHHLPGHIKSNQVALDAKPSPTIRCQETTECASKHCVTLIHPVTLSPPIPTRNTKPLPSTEQPHKTSLKVTQAATAESDPRLQERRNNNRRRRGPSRGDVGVLSGKMREEWEVGGGKKAAWERGNTETKD